MLLEIIHGPDINSLEKAVLAILMGVPETIAFETKGGEIITGKLIGVALNDEEKFHLQIRVGEREVDVGYNPDTSTGLVQYNDE